MWWRLIWWVISFAIADYFRERLPAQTASGIGDFNIPTATEGRVVPIITGGTPRVRAPNCIHYSDFAARERTVTTGVIFKEKETIGFTYELALVYALFKGECAGLTGIWIGDEKVFDHIADAGGVPQTIVDIDRDDLFGGVDDGGGFVGRVRLHNGSETQAVSTFLQSRVTLTPAYRGTSYVVVTNKETFEPNTGTIAAETRGANIGESNNLRYMTFEVQAFDTVANGALGDVLGLGNDHHFIGPDANPISVGYDILTNTRWGRRLPAAEVNLANFKTVAEVVFTEGIGFTNLIDETTTTGDLLDIVEQHIDGYIGPNPITGQFEVKLARNDYTLASEFQIGPSNLVKVHSWNKGDWSQTFNRVRIRYTDRAKEWNETHAVELAPGNRIIQGKTVTKEVRYQGCHTAAVASKLVARERRNLAQPAGSGRIELDRTAWQIRPGDVMSFTSPKVFETDRPIRVTKANVGNTKKNSMVFDCVADTFDPELATVAIPPETDFVPPVQTVVAFAAADQAAATVPFTLAQYAALPNLTPRIVAFARRTGGDPTRYEVIRRTRAVFGSGGFGSFESSGFIDAGFCTCGELRNVETDWVPGNGSLTMVVDPIGGGTLDGLFDSYDPGPASAAGIAVISPGDVDEEWLAFTSIVDDGAGIRLEGLYRSAFDSPMIAHAVNARIWFVWTGGMGLPDETHTAGEGVEVKLLPSSPTDAILEAGATAIAEIEMINTDRHARPLLPRTLSINDTEFPTTDQSADFIAQSGPEILGLRFNVLPRLWNSIDILRQVKGLDLSGVAITDSLWASITVDLEYWIYSLDATPTPVRGVDELVTAKIVWNTAATLFIISRDDLDSAGITDPFEARIEIEIEHSPAGETIDQITKGPLFFDFPVIGTFGVIPVDYAEWSFHSHFDGVDAATTAVDESNQNATITFVAQAQIDTAQSKFGGSSLLLDGSGDWTNIPSDVTLDLGTDDYTLELQIRRNVNAAHYIIGWGTGVQGAIRMAASSTILHYEAGGGDRISGGTISLATWHHVAVVRIAGTTELFIDGVSVGTTTHVADFGQATLEIGRRIGKSVVWNGWIDEVRVIKGVGIYLANFTPPTTRFNFSHVGQQISFDGTDGQTTYTTEDRYLSTVTFVADAQLDTAEFKFGSSSLLLDGTADTVSIPDNAGMEFAGDDFTVEGQIRFNATGGLKTLFSVWTTAGQRSLRISQDGTTGVNVYISTDGTAEVQVATSAQFPWSPSTATWYHFALVRDGVDLELFIDGVSVGSSSTISTDVLHNSTEAFFIGSHASTDFVNGWFDEVRVTTDTAVYTAGFTPPTKQFKRF